MKPYDKKIVLENGKEFYGYGFGADVTAINELVFNTSMVGYQEIISDPSYTDQMVCMTYPLIGNYGMTDEDYETKIPTMGGLIVREYNDLPSNFRYTKTLSEVLLEYDIPGISGDGKTFTFTVEYPKIERLKQNLIMDTADRTASCKEVLQPRHVGNPQGTLSYESSDPEIASVDSATGVITVNKPGTVTITIHVAQTDIYAAAETSYQLVISHKYSDTYKADDETHWRECACGEKTDVNNHADDNKDHKCDLCGKTLSEHTGGTATCKDKAKCEVCGESYGELDANNHTDLKHIEAKAATKTSEGNIEYWYCEGCGKYYKDAKATQEITKAQTVTAKIPSDNNTSAGGSTGNNNKPSSNATISPQTGDNSNLTLWIALLLASGGAVTATTVYGRKKKRSVK